MRYLIALGANLPTPAGQPDTTLKTVLELFDLESIKICNQSSIYDTPAYPPGSGPDFVNSVVEAESRLQPVEFMDELHGLEARLGRERSTRWAPRVVDLDLIAAGDLIQPDLAGYRKWADLKPEEQCKMTPRQLILPHPRMHERAFVLVPLAEILPNWTHPVSGVSVGEMLRRLPEGDVAAVRKRADQEIAGR
jgi:2-amino-4-hydroxy-6-hydroxymethyldihydropteridine diphosphokinase